LPDPEFVFQRYNDPKLREIPGRNKVHMKYLHPEDGQLHQRYQRGMFPSADHELQKVLQSEEFQPLLRTDSTTSDMQFSVAQYFGVHKQWESRKKTKTLNSYYKLLCLVKQTSQKDYIWISFWEGMHRQVAITLSLLCADITFDTNNSCIPKTSTSCSFSTAEIKGYQYSNIEPEEIIQKKLTGKRTNAQLLKSELTITAYTYYAG
jgi:hypothetical protein